jgi:hypothetical protein
MTRQVEGREGQAALQKAELRSGTPSGVVGSSVALAAGAACTPDQLQFENACFLAFHDRDAAVRTACRAMVSRRMGLCRPPTLEELRQADAALTALLGLEGKE